MLPKTIRAKFKVAMLKQEVEGDKIGSVKLQVVTTGSEENKRFFRYTPSGTIEMNVMSEIAMAQFKLGQEFYVDFIPVETQSEVP